MTDKFGAAIFDRPEAYSSSSPSSGYCQSNQGVGTLITGLGELTNDHYWITNIPFEITTKTQLMGTTKLLPTNFLRNKVPSILDELGLSTALPSDKAGAVSKILTNTMTIAQRHFGIEGVPNRGLSAGIASSHVTVIPQVDDNLKDACGQAFQNFVRCECPYDNMNIAFSVYLPRVKHCLDILTAGVPLGAFSLIPDTRLPASQSERLRLCLEANVPLLIKFTIDRISPEISHLVNWSNGAPVRSGKSSAARQNNQRLWACSNEFKYLSDYMDVTIHQIAVSNTPLNSNLRPPFLTPNPETSQIPHYNHKSTSYSFGLLAENYWTSLTRNIEGTITLNPTSAWIHASDRMITLTAAKKLSEAGFSVKGYCFGRIDLSVPQNKLTDLRKFCVSQNILFPFYADSQAHNTINISDPSNSDFKIVASLCTSNDIGNFLMFDEQLIAKGL